MSRLVVHKSVKNELIDKLVDLSKSLKVGPGYEKDSELTPVISQNQLEKVEGYARSGIQQGAEAVHGGKRIDREGYFMEATVLNNVSKKMTVAREEIFGPVLSVLRAQNYEEALNLVNDHQLGNGTSVYTSDGEIARHFTTNSKIGMVGVNVPIPVPMAFHSFGGWKQSLFGAHSMHGIEGINFYTKLKTITSRWPDSIKVGPEFKMPTN